jgi:integrase
MNPITPAGLSPHDWHKRPRDCPKEGPCTICGAPAAGTSRNSYYHRATLDTERFGYRFIVRKPSGKNWRHQGLCPIRRSPTAKQPPSADTPEDQAAPGAARVNDTSVPGDCTLALMARAAMLNVMEKPFVRINQALGMKRGTIERWRKQWPEHWELACNSAEAQLLKMVKAQVGTAAVLDDVDAHLERAKAAERIAGERFFAHKGKTTLSTFFEGYMVPTILYEVSPKTLDTYRGSLKLWRLITGDPPLETITTESLTLFRDALSKRRGIKPCARMTTSTVAGRLRSIQTILDKAGPPGPRNRDAKGVIASVPWVRRPRVPIELQRVISPEMFKLVYDATAGMDWPTVPGIKAPAWWKALLVVTYNTQLRRRTLFEMRMDEIDWGTSCLRLPARRMKAGRPMIVHLNPPAMQALRGIRTARELVFPFNSRHHKTFHEWFHRLQDSAGIPTAEHFGLHAIRKTAATILAGFSPQAAQLALGHTQLSTTMNHYINPLPIIGPALDAMPQPFGDTKP